LSIFSPILDHTKSEKYHAKIIDRIKQKEPNTTKLPRIIQGKEAKINSSHAWQQNNPNNNNTKRKTTHNPKNLSQRIVYFFPFEF